MVSFKTTSLNVSANAVIGTTLSALGIIYARGGDSSQWNSTYTTVCANSATWGTGGGGGGGISLATVTNYLSTSNVLMSGVNVTTDVIANRVQATVKNFYIKHPTKPNKHLVYSSLETPYHGVQLTGEAELVNSQCAVELPDYIFGLIHPDNVHIQLTNYKHSKTLYVDSIDIKNNKFVVKCDSWTSKFKTLKFFWLLNGVRKDIELLQTEV